MLNRGVQKLVFYLVCIISLFLFVEWPIKEAHALNQSQIFQQILPHRSRSGIVAKPISSENLSKIQDQINGGHLSVNVIFNQGNMDGTILSWAALGCQLELVRFLLGEENLKLDQLDVSWINRHGNNMLHFASVSLGFESCNQPLEEQSQCNLSDLISISNHLSSSSEDEAGGGTNHQESGQAVENTEPNSSSQNGAKGGRVMVTFKNMTRSSEILCLLLNAQLKDIKEAGLSAQEKDSKGKAFKNWLNQQERILGKTPGHIASEYVGAHLSWQVRRGGRLRIEEVKKSLGLSQTFFLLLRMMGADFYNIKAQMEIRGISGTRLMSVEEKIQDVSRMFIEYKELQEQTRYLIRRNINSYLRSSVASRARMSFVSPYGGGSSLTHSLGRTDLDGFGGSSENLFGQMDLEFQCTMSGCSFAMTYQSLEETNSPSTMYPFDYAISGIHKGLKEGWTGWTGTGTENLFEELDKDGKVKLPPIKCSARGQGGGPFVALGYTCYEAKKFAIWRCRFPSRYHPSSCQITACVGTDPKRPILCDTKFQHGNPNKEASE